MFPENTKRIHNNMLSAPTEEATAEPTECFIKSSPKIMDKGVNGMDIEAMRTTQLEESEYFSRLSFRDLVNSLPDKTLAILFLAFISRSRRALTQNIYSKTSPEQICHIHSNIKDLTDELKQLLVTYSLEDEVVFLCQQYLKIYERDCNE